MPRVLLLLPTTTYRAEAFVAAATRLGVDVTVASEQPNTLTRLNPVGLLTLDFKDPQAAAQRVIEFSANHGIDAVVPVDSQVVVVGAAISAALGLRHNSVESTTAAQDKHRMRQRFKQAGVPAPRFTLCSLDEDRIALANRVDFSCVVKPLSLAASQGVIRADDQRQFVRAVNRLEAILNRDHHALPVTGTTGECRAQSQAHPPASSRQFLVEQFVSGPEVALEGMLTGGELRVLALFDKPDPLDGPFFAETIYVTPSRLVAEAQEKITQCAAQAVRALGLTEGPIHAELRLANDGPSVIEVNARSIGGLCSRVLRFGTGMTLEELIIRQALEKDFEMPERQSQAAGVMMIPTARAGRLIAIRGLDEAKAVSRVEDVTISAHLGQQLVPLPEGSRYLGFIFARAESAEAVEAALRASYAQLEFVIEPFFDREDDVTATEARNSADRIYHYLVRYGALGYVCRVGSINPIPCRRGDRVVVNTHRGVELAEVLDEPKHSAVRSNQERPAGECLRVATDEDRQRHADLGDLHQRVLEACGELISQRGLPITAVDAEQLFDGHTIIVYYLGEPTEKLGPVAVELSKKADNRRVQFQPIETLPSTESKLSHEPSTQKPKRSKQELIKETSQFLRGTIMDELSCNTDKFSADDVSLLKFHGTYQQDDRDARKGRVPGVGKRHMFMVRLKIPGGRLTAGQLLGTLNLCDRFADGTLRVTTRQGLQLHGVAKGDLWQTIHEINSSLLTTLGACGDVVRNVMCCPAPRRNDRVRSQMQSTASDLAKHFAPRTAAYFEIWVDGEKRLGQSLDSNAEPTYGRTYLPRKFKIGIAIPEDNCIDVYTQDVGLLAVVEAGQLVGYNVLVGGGLGNTPSAKDTFPRLGDPLAFVPNEEIVRVVTAIVEVQRDHGNRENRRRARLKYLVDEWGVERFKTQVEEYLDGNHLAPARPVAVQSIDDHLGWHPQGDGKFYCGLYVENGRIKDRGGFRMKAGLRNLLERFRPPIRLTPQQSILLCDLAHKWQEEIDELLGEHGIRGLNEISNVRRHAMACPALPTCGLAITESERVLPRVIDRLETELARLSLNTDEFTVRMTGCPNACTRPYTADIGLVGKAAGKYTVLVGGTMRGDRLNFIYKDMVPLENIVDELLPLLTSYKRERKSHESLGDFCARTSVDDLRPL